MRPAPEPGLPGVWQTGVIRGQSAAVTELGWRLARLTGHALALQGSAALRRAAPLGWSTRVHYGARVRAGSAWAGGAQRRRRVNLGCCAGQPHGPRQVGPCKVGCWQS
jgi:hypothetical protein